MRRFCARIHDFSSLCAAHFASCSLLLSHHSNGSKNGFTGGGEGTGTTRPEENFSSFQGEVGGAKRPKKIFGGFKRTFLL